jgi:hypothetical protein
MGLHRYGPAEITTDLVQRTPGHEREKGWSGGQQHASWEGESRKGGQEERGKGERRKEERRKGRKAVATGTLPHPQFRRQRYTGGTGWQYLSLSLSLHL